MFKVERFVLSVLFCVGLFAPSAAADNGSLWVEGKSDKEIFPEIQLPSFAPVIEKLGEAVVNIRTEGKEEGYTPSGPRRYNPRPGQPLSPFDFFFNMPQQQQQRSFSSLGSGFVIHPDGYIVTNHHVVEQANKILVSFRDEKKTFQAELVGSDPKTDLALIKVNLQSNMPTAVLGDSDSVKAGDWVIAIGNPFRLGHTATVGIVSAKSRKIPGGKPYDDFIQTDASINPGNSGGPLFNAKGEVIGVNTAIYSPGRLGASTGFSIGIGFAIPINMVKTIISQLKNKGKVTRGWLGVLIQPVSPDVAEALGLSEASGALVADVVPNSPADKAGFLRGDVIVKYDGHPVEENDDLPLMVANTDIGKSVSVVIVREKKKKVLKVLILELKDEEEATASVEPEPSQLGLSVQKLTDDIAKSLGIEDSSGLVVTDVEPDSPGADAGLQRGDIILEVGGAAVNTPGEFRKRTKDLTKNKPILLLVRRGSNTLFLTLKVEQEG
jgi:serine protease Do